jgi:hypothetical protein
MTLDNLTLFCSFSAFLFCVFVLLRLLWRPAAGGKRHPGHTVGHEHPKTRGNPAKTRGHVSGRSIGRLVNTPHRPSARVIDPGE